MSTPDVPLEVENQRLMAEGLAGGAANTLNAVAARVSNYDPVFLHEAPSILIAPPNVTLLDIAPFNALALAYPTAPVAPKLTPVKVPAFPSAPVDTSGPAPVVVIPDVPGPIGDFQGTAPTLNDIPTIPPLNIDALLAALPALQQLPITIPNAPTVSLPEFTAVKPTANLPTLGNLEDEFNDSYQVALNQGTNTMVSNADAWFVRLFPNHASQVATLEARLDTYLRGGTAVDTNTASAIYEIERGKRDAEYRRVDRSALVDGGKRGWSIPDGAVFSAQLNARTAMADANADSAAEIRKMLFELEQKNVQFAVEVSRSWRSFAVQAYQGMFNGFITINGQSIDMAKSIVQALIQQFEAQLSRYKAELEGYQIEASVYGERLKAALAVLEVYKTELEAERIKAEINKDLIEALIAQIRVIETRVDVYKAQIEGIVAQAGIQRLRAEIFTATVNAYQAQVAAKESQYRGFVAQIEGQKAEVEAWAEKERAFGIQVQAYQAQVQAIDTQLRALLGYNEGIVRQSEVSTRIYEAQVGAITSQIGANVEQYKATVEGVSRENEAKARVAEMNLKQYEVAKELAIKSSELELNRAKLEADSKLGNLRLQVEVALGIAQQYSAIAQAALSGISTLLASTQSSTA